MLEAETFDLFPSLPNHHEVIVCICMPIAYKGAKKSDNDGVEQRQDEEFVDEGEKEHRVRERSRGSILSQSQTVLKNVSDSFNAQRKANHHQTQGDVELESIFDEQVSKRAETLPPDQWVHQGDL